jgi:ABC-type transport system involved in multi-copper enzyme maturation permease subunit
MSQPSAPSVPASGGESGASLAPAAAAAAVSSVGQQKTLRETVWTRLDRKATAIAEFTLRQYRTRISTWVVLGIGMLLVVMVLLFYAKAMTEGFEAVDQDGDSFDPDADGYPTGQELRLGTNPYLQTDHPGLSGIAPDPASMYIDEDDIDWDGTSVSNQGFDDDGDCTGVNWTDAESLELPTDRDTNRDGITCNVRYVYSPNSNLPSFKRDPNVDEDPDDDKFLSESLHRSFVLGFGKVGFTFIIGIFLPLFLATGLIRDEYEAKTLHYLVGKPIARAEVLTYRLLGYIALTWPYVTVLVLLTALVTGFLAPSEGIFRFGDMGMWLGILIASYLVLLAYGAIFSTFGIISPKFGIFMALGFGVWEFIMAMFSLTVPNLALSRLSVSHWGIQIIDSAATLNWPDYYVMLEQSRAYGFEDQVSLDAFWNPPAVIVNSGMANLVVSMLVLLFISVMAVFIGQAAFKRRELN